MTIFLQNNWFIFVYASLIARPKTCWSLWDQGRALFWATAHWWTLICCFSQCKIEWIAEEITAHFPPQYFLMQLPLSSNSNNQNGVKLMKDWFPRHWKCGPASEMVNNLGEIQSVCLPPSHLTETATLIFIVCGNDTLWNCRLCSAVGCSGSEVSATSGDSWILCFDFYYFPTALPNLLEFFISILAQRPMQGFWGWSYSEKPWDVKFPFLVVGKRSI